MNELVAGIVELAKQTGSDEVNVEDAKKSCMKQQLVVPMMSLKN